MGYCISVTELSVRIKKENHDACLKAIKALHGKETISDAGGRHFSWVDYDFWMIHGLREMLAVWRWYPEYDDMGNIVDLEFTGEKYGDDNILFTQIAPFIEKGSYIEFRGEDNDHWRWEFDGQTKKEFKGAVVWVED